MESACFEYISNFSSEAILHFNYVFFLNVEEEVSVSFIKKMFL